MALSKQTKPRHSQLKDVDINRAHLGRYIEVVSSVSALESYPIAVSDINSLFYIQGYYEGWSALSKNFGNSHWRVVDTSHVTPNGIDIVQSLVEPLVSFKLLEQDDSRNYGATYTTPTETRLRLQRFFDNMGTGGTGHLHEFDYKTDGALSYEGKIEASLYVEGAANIRSLNDAEPVFIISGRVSNIYGTLEIGYDDSIVIPFEAASENKVGVLLKGLARCVISCLRIRHVGTGIKIAQETGFGYPNGQNALFSVTFSELDINDFAYEAFDFRAWNGGNTGCSISNFYMTNYINNVVKSCERFGRIGATSEWDFGQINFERGRCKHLMSVGSDVNTLSFSAIHIEGVEPTNETHGFFYFNNKTKVSISSMSLVDVAIDGNELENYSMFRVGEKVGITIDALSERSNDVTNSPNLRIVRYEGSASERSAVRIKEAELEHFDLLEFNQVQGTKPALIVDDLYPVKGLELVDDSSFYYNPPSTERKVIYRNLTVARNFDYNHDRAYAGSFAEVDNTSNSFPVSVRAITNPSGTPSNVFTGTVPAGEKRTLYYEGGTSYLLL